MTSCVILLSLLIDRLFAEPIKFHPLVGFGTIANALEQRYNTLVENNKRIVFKKRLLGGLACLLLSAIPTVLLWCLIETIGNNSIALIIEIIILYLVIGCRSLEQHAVRVKTSLLEHDIDAARRNVSYIVSRETNKLDETDVCKATIESVLENGSDAVFAPIFWFLIAGAPGALFYRLVNTLDAMWGYRNSRYSDFGCFTARLDDLLNYLPARITALSYSLSGNFKQGIHSWRTQTKDCESPNAGPVMASGAGALNVELGGTAIYHGKEKTKPILGTGASPLPLDIDRAVTLVKKALLLWIICILMIDIVMWLP